MDNFKRNRLAFLLFLVNSNIFAITDYGVKIPENDHCPKAENNHVVGWDTLGLYMDDNLLCGWGYPNIKNSYYENITLESKNKATINPDGYSKLQDVSLKYKDMNLFFQDVCFLSNNKSLPKIWGQTINASLNNTNITSKRAYVNPYKKDFEFIFEDIYFNRKLAESKSLSGSCKSMLHKPKIYKMHDVFITTCNPKNPDWEILSDKVEIDEVKSRVIVENGLLKMLGLPVFYWPWLSFPLTNHRQSGFLEPKFYLFGGEFWSEIPYYLNIAPNLDLSFKLGWYGDFGLGTTSKFRWLSENGEGSWFHRSYWNSLIVNDEDRSEKKASLYNYIEAVFKL